MKTFIKLIRAIVLIACWQSAIAQDNPKIVTFISGKIDQHIKSDSVTLIVSGPFYDDAALPEQGASLILRSAINQDGEFKFKVQTDNSPYHFSMLIGDQIASNKFSKSIYNFLIHAGDNVTVTFESDKPKYKGDGAYLLEVQQKIKDLDIGNTKLTFDPDDIFRKDPMKWLIQKDSILNIGLNLLETYRSKIPPIEYGIVRADVIAENRMWIYRRISFAGPFFVSGTPLSSDLKSLCNELKDRQLYFNTNNPSVLSPKYIHYLYDKLISEVKFQRILNNNSIGIDDNYFEAINSQYTGIVRDKLLAYWLLRIASLNGLLPVYLDEALSVMQDQVFRKVAVELKSTFGKGAVIDDFAFKDNRGKSVHLSDFKGKVVFVDLWFSGCTGCVAVATGLPKVEKLVDNPGQVAFVSISIDKDQQKWLSSISKNHTGKLYTHYTTPTTTYLYTGGTGSNNAFIKKYVPSNSYPSLLIINAEGKLFSANPSWPISDQGREELVKEINLALHD